MKFLQFATSNVGKFEEMQMLFGRLYPEVELRILNVDIPEPQTTNSEEILRAKAAWVGDRTTLPFIVDDVSCVLEETNGFPGALAKSVLGLLGQEEFERIFPEGRGIMVKCDLAMSYLGELSFFTGEVSGIMKHGAYSVLRNAGKLSASVFLPEQGCLLGAAETGTHRMKAVEALTARLRSGAVLATQALEATAARWTARSTSWTENISSAESYVNHENGYARFDAVLERVLKESGNRTALDVGCGTGQVTRALASQGFHAVLGIDTSSGMVAQAERESSNHRNAKFLTASLEDAAAHGPYDVITSRGVVLSHMPRTQAIDYLRALTGCSAEGTYLVFDFIQTLANGGFGNKGDKSEYDFEQLSRILRELGWVPVAKDGESSARVVVAAFHRPYADSRYFVTGNAQKVLELRTASGMKHLHGCDFDLPELKSDDIVGIAVDKARRSYNVIRHPVIVTDGGIFFDKFGGFPGSNSKQAAELLGPDGLIKLFVGSDNRSGVRRNAVACFDGVTMTTYCHEVALEISETPRGDYPAYPMDKILIPLSLANPKKLTYAEMPLDKRVAFTELSALAEFVRMNT